MSIDDAIGYLCDRIIKAEARAQSAEAKAATLAEDNERLRSELDEIVQRDSRILSGSPGPLYDAGFQAGAKWQSDAIRALLAPYRSSQGEGK